MTDDIEITEDEAREANEVHDFSDALLSFTRLHGRHLGDANLAFLFLWHGLELMVACKTGIQPNTREHRVMMESLFDRLRATLDDLDAVEVH